MALAVKDGNKDPATIKSELVSGEHVTFHNIWSIIPGTGADNLGKAAGGTYATGHAGVGVLAVHRTVPAAPSTNGKYSHLGTDDFGRLWANVGRDTVAVTVIPTITAAAYTDGHVVGGLLEFSGAHRLAGGSGRVVGCVIRDKNGLTSPLDLFLWESSPAASSTLDDNAAPVLDVAHVDKLLDVVQIRDAHWSTMGARSWAKVPMDRGFKLASGQTSLFGVLICRPSSGSPPTYASTSDLAVRLIIEQ